MSIFLAETKVERETGMVQKPGILLYAKITKVSGVFYV
jgi:hypothetical protein